ncbi:MAG: DNA-binding response regulator [Chloroflexi bacterium]|nr:MAG: DNA-binding response regulator [Chloroflexota bacterium]
MPHPASVTQVIILAENALHLSAWNALLNQQPGLAVWATVANHDDLAALSPPPNPATLLIDIPKQSPEFVRHITQHSPNYGSLVLIDEYELAEIVSLLQAGAAGCLSRNATIADLSRAIIATGRGEIVLPPTLAAQALTALARGEILQKQPEVDALTSRESDVLHLLAKGLTNKDIAQTLFLSVRTVEAHLRNIYGKLRVSSRTEAVLWAVEHGWETHQN